jgi:predicted MFS family arabinose efflux permease
VHPQLKVRLNLSPAALGTVLLMLGLGVLAGIQLAGRFLDRLGSRRTCGGGVIVFAIAINLPAMARGSVSLALALFALGVGCGLTEIGITDQATRVERAYERPIMSSIHAFYSIGATVGAALAAGLQELHIGLHLELLCAAAVAATTALLAVPRLHAEVWPGPGGGAAQRDVRSAGAPSSADHRDTPRSTIVVLALLVLIFMLSEGVANDWSALEAIERYRVARPTASVAFLAFMGATTAGRLSVDRLARRVGPIVVLRTGALFAAIALVSVVCAPTFRMATIAWAVFGVALAGLLPQVFTALGDVHTPARGLAVSRVVGAGYVGLLAGPGVIGGLSRLVGLRHALLLPALLCLLSVCLAHRVTSGRGPHGSRGRSTMRPDSSKVRRFTPEKVTTLPVGRSSPNAPM